MQDILKLFFFNKTEVFWTLKKYDQKMFSEFRAEYNGKEVYGSLHNVLNAKLASGVKKHDIPKLYPMQ